MKPLRSICSTLRRRWRRISIFALAAVLLGYGGVCAATTLAISPTDRFVSLPGGRLLAYSSTGPDDAPVRVLLIHGAPADASSWRRFLDAHAAEFPTVEFITVDRLGYGKSGGAVETSLDAHARSLEPLLTSKTILVGHSYGGPVALATAAFFPERVAGLVLAAGATDPDMHDAQGFRRFLDAMSPVIPEAWTNANLELLALTDENARVAELLPNVACHVVAVHGEWDPVCPSEGTTNHLREALVGAPSVTIDAIPYAGHNVHLNHHDRIAMAIRDLLQTN